ERGIRTLGGVSPTHDFQSCRFSLALASLQGPERAAEPLQVTRRRDGAQPRRPRPLRPAPVLEILSPDREGLPMLVRREETRLTVDDRWHVGAGLSVYTAAVFLGGIGLGLALGGALDPRTRQTLGGAGFMILLSVLFPGGHRTCVDRAARTWTIQKRGRFGRVRSGSL